MAFEVELPDSQPAADAARQLNALAAGSGSSLAAAAARLAGTRLQQLEAEASPPSSPTQGAQPAGQQVQGSGEGARKAS